MLHRPENRRLRLDGHRLVLGLLEELDDARAAVERGLCAGVEIGAELRERGELAILREVALDFSGHLLHRLDLRGGADARNRKPDRNRGPHALVKQVGFQVDLAVGDRDDVRRDVGRHVAGLGLDDRQRRERAVAVFFAEARGAFEQPAVEVEDIARIGFAPGRALEQQRDLAVGVGVLGQVVEHDERVHAVVHEPFAHRGTGEGGNVLLGRRIGGGRGDDDRVSQRVVFFECPDYAGDVRVLLADPDVDRIKRAECRVPALLAGLVDPGLVDDRIHRDRGLARRAVADDELALSAADRDHRVDRHDAGLHRLAHAFALDDARGDVFHGIKLGGVDRALAVERLAERIDHAAEQAFADGNLEEPAGGLDLVALADRRVVAEKDRAHLGFFEVESEPDETAGKLQHLVEHRAAEAFELGHAVADLADDADVGFARGGRLDRADFFFEFEDDIAHGW